MRHSGFSQADFTQFVSVITANYLIVDVSSLFLSRLSLSLFSLSLFSTSRDVLRIVLMSCFQVLSGIDLIKVEAKLSAFAIPILYIKQRTADSFVQHIIDQVRERERERERKEREERDECEYA